MNDTGPISRALAITKRGAVELLPQSEWVNKLIAAEKEHRPLRIKLGLDPTAPDIHLGHTVVLNKLRQLQDIGHVVDLVIGDFTARIGDPTGRSTARPVLTLQQVDENAQTYVNQIFKVLDPAKTFVQRNSAWLNELGALGMLKLASQSTVARMLERDDFKSRYENEQPISIHEFLYPLLQGYDSVQLVSDLEVGGTDQKFNLLVGRHLQEQQRMSAQCVLTMPLLVGTDGVHKMSKSKNNYIGITEDPLSMYSKVMSISDNQMWDWFTLLSFKSEAHIAGLQASVVNGGNPKYAKVALAKEIVTRFHSEQLADSAEQEFNDRARGIIPDVIPEVVVFVAGPIAIGSLLKFAGLADSATAGGRLVDQRGVRVDGVVITDRVLRLGIGTYIIQVGKRKFARVTITEQSNNG